MLFEKLSLEPQEEILKTVRKHWFIIVTQLLAMVVTALFPLVLLLAALQIERVTGLFSFDMAQFAPGIMFITAAWLLFSTFSAFVIWTHYYLDIWIITDRRIIAVEQAGFFNRNVAIFRLERLQDIEFSIKGLIGTFFNFGTLSAQTAGHTEANFKSTGMPHPDELQAIIQKAMDARLSELNNKPSLSKTESAGE
jgi:hypothetical protein